MVTWQTKSLVQRIFSSLPKGEYWNYLCQRYITKGLPISYDKFVADVGSKVYEPLKVFMEQDKNLSSKVYFEFGAGWDLLTPIGVSLAGMGDIRIVDIRPLVRPNLIQQTLSYYAKYLAGGGGIAPLECQKQIQDSSNKLSITIPSSFSSIQQCLKNTFNISYHIKDAAQTGFADNEVDYICSYSVLEHIPLDSIRRIFSECYRVLKPNGRIVFLIDYQDHYSYFDSNLSIYNFLRFSSKEWEKYNCSLHYQNRLRHSDFVRLFEQSGLKILECNSCGVSMEQESILKSIPLADEFKQYDFDDLKIPGDMFVLTKE